MCKVWILLLVNSTRKLVHLNNLFPLAPFRGVKLMLCFALGIIHCQRSSFKGLVYDTDHCQHWEKRKVPCGHVQDKWPLQQLVQNPSR